MHEVHLAYAGLLLILIAAAGSLTRMDSLTQARTDTTAYQGAVRQRQTWIMSLLHIGTFDSFIGYPFALPLVLKNTFPELLGRHPFIATCMAGSGFAGALVGSPARPLGGLLSDRVGGARVTLACVVGMAAFTLLAVAPVNSHSFTLFFASNMVIFLLAGPVTARRIA